MAIVLTKSNNEKIQRGRADPSPVTTDTVNKSGRPIKNRSQIKAFIERPALFIHVRGAEGGFEIELFSIICCCMVIPSLW